MARPSKLTPEQWAEIQSRRAAGETWRALAKEFGVDESSIRERGKCFPVPPLVRQVAEKMADARAALEKLPPAQQYTAIGLADQLHSISINLAEAGSMGASTARLLQRHASAIALKINPAASIEKAGEHLRTVGALMKVANDASQLGLGLLGATRERGKPPGDVPPAGAAPGAVVPVFNIGMASE